MVQCTRCVPIVRYVGGSDISWYGCGYPITIKRVTATDWASVGFFVAVSVAYKPLNFEFTWWCCPTDSVYCAPTKRSYQQHLSARWAERDVVFYRACYQWMTSKIHSRIPENACRYAQASFWCGKITYHGTQRTCTSVFFLRLRNKCIKSYRENIEAMLIWITKSMKSVLMS